MIFQCVFSEYYSLCIPPCNIESQCMSRWCCFTMYLWWSFTVYSLCIPPCNIESQCMFPWYCTDPSPGQSLRGNVFVSPFLLPKRNINDNLKPFKHYQKYITFPDQLSDCYQVLTDSVKMSVIFDDMNMISYVSYFCPRHAYIILLGNLANVAIEKFLGAIFLFEKDLCLGHHVIGEAKGNVKEKFEIIFKPSSGHWF